MKKPFAANAILIALACFGMSPCRAQTYAYDAAGRLLSVVYSSGHGIRYSYDDADNLLQVESTAGTPPSEGSLTVPSGGIAEVQTAGTATQTTGGWATLDNSSGEAPYGVAILSLVQNGVVIFEAGIPASPPTTRTRIFIDRRTGVRSSSKQFDGAIAVDTGVAVANPGPAAATVHLTLRNAAGAIVASGDGSLKAGQHVARLSADLNFLAPNFHVPADFASKSGFGSLDVESDQPISVTALRATFNERGDVLFTSTGVSDLNAAPESGAVYFPHLAEGGGFNSSFVLLNNSSTPETGTVEFLGNTGAPLKLALTDGRSGTSFPYTIPSGGVVVMESSGAGTPSSGWARVVPGAGQPSPVATGSFRVCHNGIVTTESGILTAKPTTLARIFVDNTDGHNTGLAIANPGDISMQATLRAYEVDGQTPAGSGPAIVNLGPHFHVAGQAGDFLKGLPAGFRGVLEIESQQPFAALTVRSLVNRRGDLLFATLPVADLRQPAPAPVVFPHIADGGGFKTELVLLGGAGPVSTNLLLFDDNGMPLSALQP